MHVHEQVTHRRVNALETKSEKAERVAYWLKGHGFSSSSFPAHLTLKFTDGFSLEAKF